MSEQQEQQQDKPESSQQQQSEGTQRPPQQQQGNQQNPQQPTLPTQQPDPAVLVVLCESALVLPQALRTLSPHEVDRVAGYTKTGEHLWEIAERLQEESGFTLPALPSRDYSEGGFGVAIRKLMDWAKRVIAGERAETQAASTAPKVPDDPNKLPAEPSREYCLVAPKTIRWRISVETRPQVWHLLGAAIDSGGKPVSINDLMDSIFSGDSTSIKTIRNAVSALNGVLIDIGFPWRLKVQAEYLIRDMDGDGG